MPPTTSKPDIRLSVSIDLNDPEFGPDATLAVVYTKFQDTIIIESLTVIPAEPEPKMPLALSHPLVEQFLTPDRLCAIYQEHFRKYWGQTCKVLYSPWTDIRKLFTVNRSGRGHAPAQVPTSPGRGACSSRSLTTTSHSETSSMKKSALLKTNYEISTFGGKYLVDVRLMTYKNGRAALVLTDADSSGVDYGQTVAVLSSNPPEEFTLNYPPFIFGVKTWSENEGLWEQFKDLGDEIGPFWEPVYARGTNQPVDVLSGFVRIPLWKLANTARRLFEADDTPTTEKG